MTAKISKWGNSQGLRVPKDVMENLHLNIGDDVNITIEDNKVILEPVKKEIPKYNLEELITKMPNNYTPKEDITSAIGNEEW